jgi:zinc protease
MLEKLQQVTAAQVQAVAKKYFIDDTLTVGVLEPQPLDGKPRRPSVATRH